MSNYMCESHYIVSRQHRSRRTFNLSSEEEENQGELPEGGFIGANKRKSEFTEQLTTCLELPIYFLTLSLITELLVFYFYFTTKVSRSRKGSTLCPRFHCN